MVMPFLIKALLDKRRRFERMVAEEGAEAVLAREPEARGYLRDKAGYRLFEQREELCRRLTEDVRQNGDWLAKTTGYPLAGG